MNLKTKIQQRGPTEPKTKNNNKKNLINQTNAWQGRVKKKKKGETTYK